MRKFTIVGGGQSGLMVGIGLLIAWIALFVILGVSGALSN